MKPWWHIWFVCLLLPVGTVRLAAQDKLQETPYYPLKVGTTWHYRAGDNKFTIRVVRHEKVGGVLCALLQTQRDGKVVGSEHLSVNSEGVYRHNLSEAGKTSVLQTLEPPILLLKLPPKSGDSWKVNSKSDGKVFQGSFQVAEQQITVPAGTYRTFRVASQDLEVNSLRPILTTFFAEGVGMVKQVIEMGDARIEIELEKFELGGQ